MKRLLFLFLLCLGTAFGQHIHKVNPSQETTPTLGETRYYGTTDWLAGTANYVGWKGVATPAGNRIFQLPSDFPASTKCLEMTSAGVIQFDADPCAGAGGGHPVTDDVSIVENLADPTKEARLDLSLLTTGTIRVLTVQDADHTLAGLELAQTFTEEQVISVTSAPADGTLVVQSSSDEQVRIVAKSTGAGVSSAGQFRQIAGTAQGSLTAHDPARTVARWGLTDLGNTWEILHHGGDYVILGSNVATADLILGTNSLDRLHIQADGDVGINEASPSAKLDVGGTLEVNGVATMQNIVAAGDSTYTWGDNTTRPSKVYADSLNGRELEIVDQGATPTTKWTMDFTGGTGTSPLQVRDGGNTVRVSFVHTSLGYAMTLHDDLGFSTGSTYAIGLGSGNRASKVWTVDLDVSGTCTGCGGAGGGYATIENNDSPLAQETVLNFAASLTASAGSGQTDVALNLGNANTWTATQTFSTVNSTNLISSGGTITGTSTFNRDITFDLGGARRVGSPTDPADDMYSWQFWAGENSMFTGSISFAHSGVVSGGASFTADRTGGDTSLEFAGQGLYPNVNGLTELGLSARRWNGYFNTIDVSGTFAVSAGISITGSSGIDAPSAGFNALSYAMEVSGAPSIFADVSGTTKRALFDSYAVGATPGIDRNCGAAESLLDITVTKGIITAGTCG